MAFYYVRDNGTFIGAAVGDAGRSVTARVGVWDANTANSYPSIKSIFADQAITGNTLVDADVVIVANDHSEIYNANVTIGIINVSNYVVTIIESKSVLNSELYLKGALLQTTLGYINLGANSNFRCGFLLKGLVITSQNTINMKAPYAQKTLVDVDATAVKNIDFTGLTSYGSNLVCQQLGGSCDSINGGTIITTWGTGMTSNITRGDFIDVDFSGVTGDNYLAQGYYARFVRCKMKTYPPSVYNRRPPQKIEYIGCSASGNDYSNYYCLYGQGDISTNSSLYLNYKYDGTNKIVYEMMSIAYCSAANQLRHKLCEIPAQDLSVVDTTYRVNLLLDTATAASLTDSEFWIELSHNDNNSLSLGKIVSSRKTDILATGTTLTTSAEVWQGTLPATSQAYQVDIILSAASLPNVTNGNVVIYANLAVPNVSVYVDPAVQIGV